MSNTIILNRNNLIGINNNTYQYNFIQGNYDIPRNSQMCVSQITLPYSWYNVSSILGNNTFSYTMPTTGSTTATITITLPDGFYDATRLNQYLYSDLKTRKYYFYDSTTGTSNPTIIYPINFSYNTTKYTTDINFYYIPSSSGNVQSQFGTNYVWALGTYPTLSETPSVFINPVSTRQITTQASSTIATNTIIATSTASSITGTSLTITVGTGTVAIGQFITGSGVLQGTVISAGSGTSWTVNKAQTVASTSMNYYTSNPANGLLTLGASNTLVQAGQYVTGTGVRIGTQILSGSGTSWQVSFPQTVSSTTITFSTYNPLSNQTYSFGNVFGFPVGAYPPQKVYYEGSVSIANGTGQPVVVSGNSLLASPAFSPLGSSVNAVIVRCNLVQNDVSAQSDILDVLPINAAFGSNINYNPLSQGWVKLKSGKFSSLVITLFDQNLNPILAQDPNLLISLLIQLG